jgi:hypothetical protein
MAFCGSVEIRIRLPGESGLRALRRRWREEMLGG